MEMAKRCPTNKILCGVVWFLITWILVDFIVRSEDYKSLTRDQSAGFLPDRLYQPRWTTQAEGRRGDEICNTRDGHFEDEPEDKANENAWRQMKWIGESAACRVRGQLIEKLDAANNFRRGFALQFTSNVEDRMHILPWLLGTKVDLNRRKRRVYLDLGANTFSSSIKWFIRMYPCDFTEIHAFEISERLLTIPKPFDEQSNWIAENSASRRTKGISGIPGWMLNRIKLYNNLVSDEDDLETKAINITRFIKEDLQLSADDAVIVKMDIEETEWPILTRWLNDPEMVDIVDEIFVEVHYKHPSMFDYHWDKFKRGRNQAKRLIADLRWKGFYVHFWP